MKAAHINPFLNSMINTFSTMVDCELRRGEISLNSSAEMKYPISGVIGLSGKAVGTVVINLSEELALHASSHMLMAEVTEMNPDVIDVVGELANMIAGSAKAELEEYELSVSLPNVVTGTGHDIRFPSGTHPISVAYESDFGPLTLEVGLETSCVPVAS